MRFTFLLIGLLGRYVVRPRWPRGPGIPGDHRFLAIPVPIPNTVVKQEPPMILRQRESRLSPGFLRPWLREPRAFFLDPTWESFRARHGLRRAAFDVKGSECGTGCPENPGRAD